MSRPQLFLLAAVLASAAAPAIGQTWPGGAVTAAGVQALGPQGRKIALTDQTAAIAWRAPDAPAAAQPIDRPHPVTPPERIAQRDDDTPKVDIQAKPEWSDDQGFRASPTKLSYKRRF